MCQAIYIAERSFPEDRPPNFVTDRRISDYTPPCSFSQQNTQSALRSATTVHGRELSVMQNSLPVGVPQNWRDKPLAMYSDSSEMPTSSRDMSKNPDLRMFYHKVISIRSFCLNLILFIL